MTGTDRDVVSLRRDTQATWALVNPVLGDGEPGVEFRDNAAPRFKIGDGVTAWNDLGYVTAFSLVSTVNGEFGDVTVTPAKIQAATAAQGARADSAVQPAQLTKSAVGLGQVDNTSDMAKPVSTAQASALAGKADLVNGTVPSAQLPSYVDDVVEYANQAAFPATGETGKLYVALDTSKLYRWSGSVYAVISDTITLGETAATAYRGDRGKTAFDHSQITTGNPHGTTASDVGAPTTAQFNSEVTRAQTAEQANTDAINANKTAVAQRVPMLPFLATVNTSTALTKTATQPVDASNAAVTMTALPALSGLSVGDAYAVEKVDTSTNAVTIPFVAGDTTLTGSTSVTLTLRGTVTLVVAVTATNTRVWRAVNHVRGDSVVQPTLVSGSNIKTVGGQSILGSGDIGVATLDTGGHLPEAQSALDSRRFSLSRRVDAISETFPRLLVNNVLQLTSGQLQFAAIPLLKGQTVSKIGFYAQTGPTSPTAQWFALYGPSTATPATPALLAVTSDDTTTAWTNNTAKVLSLTAAFTVPADGLYYIAVMVAASTTPSLLVCSGNSAVMGIIAPMLCGRDAAHNNLTTPSTAPSTATLGTSVSQLPYAWVVA